MISYIASGTSDLFLYDQIGCTYTGSPNSFSIEPNALAARLSIFEGDGAIYTWSGGQQVDYTKTSLCPGWRPR